MYLLRLSIIKFDTFPVEYNTSSPYEKFKFAYAHFLQQVPVACDSCLSVKECDTLSSMFHIETKYPKIKIKLSLKKVVVLGKEFDCQDQANHDSDDDEEEEEGKNVVVPRKRELPVRMRHCEQILSLCGYGAISKTFDTSLIKLIVYAIMYPVYATSYGGIVAKCPSSMLPSTIGSLVFGATSPFHVPQFTSSSALFWIETNNVLTPELSELGSVQGWKYVQVQVSWNERGKIQKIEKKNMLDCPYNESQKKNGMCVVM